MQKRTFNLVAVANQSGAMETETIQKNGVMPKDLRSRNHKIIGG